MSKDAETVHSSLFAVHSGDAVASPKISVVVPVYKVEKYLRECVESVLAQTFTDFELILVDDGSPDNSGAICDEFAARDSRVRVFHKENGGVSSARNLGVAHARGEWIAFLDSDDWWDTRFLEEMFMLAQKFPNVGCCCCGYRCGNSDDRGQGEETLVHELARGASGEINLFKTRDAQLGSLPIWTGAILLKKTEISRAGGFDETLVIYEDYALWVPVILNAGMAYLNKPLAFHRLDSPIENKPRGRLPSLRKHWVSRLGELDEFAQKRPEFKFFLDRFRLRALLAYRNVPAERTEYLKIFREVSPKNFWWKFRIFYTVPAGIAPRLMQINAFVTKFLKKFHKNKK